MKWSISLWKHEEGGLRELCDVFCAVHSVYCGLVRCLAISFFHIFSVSGTLGLLLLIFPTRKVGIIDVEALTGETGV